jgi:adenosine deaminase
MRSADNSILAAFIGLRHQYVSRLMIRQLHAHLSGSISRQCLHDIWLQKASNKDMDGHALQDPLIEMPEDKYDYDLETFFPLFSKYIYALCNDAPSIIYSTNSVLQSFQEDGVIYLELRTTPRAILSAGITKDHYVQLVLSCISSLKSSTMTTKLILSIDRRNSEEEAFDVVNLALKYRFDGVVGVDLCGDPAKGDVSIFREAFKRAKDEGLGITLHFAEAQQSSTDTELRTLLSYEPDRIGHVINVPDGIRETIIARQIGLELCLSCNVHAKMITGSFGDHHFGYWRGKGCPVILCVSLFSLISEKSVILILTSECRVDG